MRNALLVLLIVGLIVLKGKAQENSFPYKLKSIDIAYLSIGAGTKYFAHYLEEQQKLMTVEEMLKLERNDIVSFDRSATKKWNKDLGERSDLTRNILLAAPASILAVHTINKEWKKGAVYAVMYFETALLTWGLTELTKVTVKRKRPYLYNTNISLDERTEKISDDNVFDSFYSGHTAAAFSAAVFFSKTYTDIYGKSKWSKVIWASSITLAATTGYLRYASGHHYPTDVVVGAIVGSGIGYAIPLIHKRNVISNDLSLGVGYNSLYCSYRF